MAGVILPTPSTDAVLRFVRGQHPTRTPELRDGRNRVTAGNAALTPRDRFDIEKFFEKRAFTDRAVREDIANKQALSAPDGNVPTTLLEAQVGKPLHSRDIIARLKKLNSTLVFERSKAFPDIMGIYLPDPEMPERDGRRLRHIAGFEFGFSPEYTVRHPEAKGAKKITKGYRQLILQLVKERLISFSRAEDLFQLRSGRQSRNWAIATGQRTGIGLPT